MSFSTRYSDRTEEEDRVSLPLRRARFRGCAFSASASSLALSSPPRLPSPVADAEKRDLCPGVEGDSSDSGDGDTLLRRRRRPPDDDGEDGESLNARCISR